MANINEEFDWLSIDISCRNLLFFGKVLITIRFSNTRKDYAELYFTNTKKRAEQIGLQIIDETGHILKPDPGLMIRPANKKIGVNRLTKGKSFTYKLKGRFRKGKLLFPGASYDVEPGVKYNIRFQYEGVWSNTIVWQPLKK